MYPLGADAARTCIDQYATRIYIKSLDTVTDATIGFRRSLTRMFCKCHSRSALMSALHLISASCNFRLHTICQPDNSMRQYHRLHNALPEQSQGILRGWHGLTSGFSRYTIDVDVHCPRPVDHNHLSSAHQKFPILWSCWRRPSQYARAI